MAMVQAVTKGDRLGDGAAMQLGMSFVLDGAFSTAHFPNGEELGMDGGPFLMSVEGFKCYFQK